MVSSFGLVSKVDFASSENIDDAVVQIAGEGRRLFALVLIRTCKSYIRDGTEMLRRRISDIKLQRRAGNG